MVRRSFILPADLCVQMRAAVGRQPEPNLSLYLRQLIRRDLAQQEAPNAR